MADDRPAPDSVVLAGEADCIRFFHDSIKPLHGRRVGLEYEMVLIDKLTSLAVPFFGHRSLSTLLGELVPRGWQPVLEGGLIVGLRREAASVSLEPGGQLEFSGSPHSDVAPLLSELVHFLGELRPVCERLAIAIVCTGYRPFGSARSVATVPRRRYRELMPLLTEQARMATGQKMTTSMQVSLDYTSELHAGHLLQLGLKCQPLIVAMFGNSPLSQGRPTRWNSYRMQTWSGFGSQRAGIPPVMLESGFPQHAFAHYTRWALEKPLLLIQRAGDLKVVPDCRFAQFLKHGWSGYRATVNDWSMHLGTLFPEARLKRVVELRSADTCTPPMAAALAVIWKGLAYSDESKQEALDLLKGFGSVNLPEIYMTASRLGLSNRGPGSLRDLSLKLLDIVDRGLSRRSGSNTEKDLLAPVVDAVKAGRSPANAVVDAFRREGSLAALKASHLDAARMQWLG